MPSMRCGFSWLEWSARAWLNLTSWSTASLPTRASPTNSTRSGLFTVISLARARIRGSLSCIRPAVSMRTTSILVSRA
uniref:Putative secreted protein n=1 Tax=Ixodes ricinus TaxID=34613 RepID=A0A6B0TWN5_IXORI